MQCSGAGTPITVFQCRFAQANAELLEPRKLELTWSVSIAGKNCHTTGSRCELFLQTNLPTFMPPLATKEAA